MKIAFVGTRGIPNNYGGLEECAEHVSVGLAERGHEVIVYNPHFHPYREATFKGVIIIRILSPEGRIGTAANFIYDYLSIKDAVKQKCDAIVLCGYGTSAISFYFLHLGKCKIFTNLDGIEWKRSKWRPWVQKLMKWFEEIAIKKSHVLIADNIGIQNYLRENYTKESYFIPYAADVINIPDENVIHNFGLEKYNYHCMIGRLEPENNIEMIFDGINASSSPQKVHVFANHETRFGNFLKNKYCNAEKIVFCGWTSGQDTLNQLRHFAKIYFHGHSVGGTNPSLLEAMAAGTFISAHDNVFNRNVLGDDALYFSSSSDVKNIIDNFEVHSPKRQIFGINNIQKIKTFYNWHNITNSYEKMFLEEVGK